jgi:hypothetical protein
VIESWTSGSEMRWIATSIVTATTLILWLGRSRIGFRATAKALLLALALLVCISMIAFGPDSELGFRIAYQDAPRLAQALLFFGMVAIAVTSWALTEYWPGRMRILWIGAITAAALVFVISSVFDTPFMPENASVLPVILESGCLLAGLSYVVLRFYRPERGEPPLLTERWFEFSLVALAVASSAGTLMK